MVKLGVFDSGIGGEYVANRLKSRLPGSELITYSDTAHMPYGQKTVDQMLGFLKPIMANFEHQEVEAIIIACNTVATNLLPELKKMTSVPVLGFTPPLGVAVDLSQTKKILVCATPATLASQHYQRLKRTLENQAQIIDKDCATWANLIEAGQMEMSEIKQLVAQARQQKVDCIVLGCTHYHWIQITIQDLAGQDIKVIQPTEMMIDHLLTILPPPG